MALAPRTLRRCGTAAKVERIIPVLNSLVTTSTPSTAIANWAKNKPLRLNVVGLKSILSCTFSWS
jgi:hypothetical protein